MIVLQLILFCVLFTLMVKLAVRDDTLNALNFYTGHRAICPAFTTA